MSAFARTAVLAILRQHGLPKADAGAIVDEDDRAALGAFLPAMAAARTNNAGVSAARLTTFPR